MRRDRTRLSFDRRPTPPIDGAPSGLDGRGDHREAKQDAEPRQPRQGGGEGEGGGGARCLGLARSLGELGRGVLDGSHHVTVTTTDRRLHDN